MTLPKLPTINQELLSQLRGLFFSKDNPIMLPNNGFIGLHSIDTPSQLPPFPYRFIYVKADGCVYILDYNGNEYKVFSSDIAGNLYVNGSVNITGEYQINGYNTADFISPYMGLPGLIGFWPMATVQRSTGNVPNYAPTYTGATKQDLVYNGNPTFDYTTTGVPYISLDGTGDYLSVADNTDLDILGTEAQYANPGLTLGCWFNVDTSGASRGIISKFTAVGQLSYYIFANAADKFVFVYSTDGNSGAGSSESATSAATLSTGTWYFGVGRWTPSRERSVFLNGVQTQTAASAFATLFNSNSALEIGRVQATNLIDGRVTLAFLCASALSDAIIQSLFQQTRSLFGVL